MKTTTKQIIASVMTIGAMASANALEIDIYGAFGMDDEPIFQYLYDDGSTQDLMAGGGIGVYAGHSQRVLGPVKAQLRGGIQHGIIEEVDGQVSYRDTFTYFPLYANLMVNVSPEISIVGGAFYALNPFYKQTVNDNHSVQRLQSDVGYNLALRWMATPKSPDNDNTLYMEVRYEYTEAELTTYSDTLGNSVDLSGLFEPIPITNLGLAIGLKF